MKRGAKRLRMGGAILVLGVILASPPSAKAVDLGELTKYLTFIEGFQYFFEFCQAEAALSEKLVASARNHIGERRALIFAGLHEIQRDRIVADMAPKKPQMIKSVLDSTKRDKPGVTLADLCKQGFFEGIMDSEQKSAEKEVAAIRKAKN